jgi:tetratricopeptide (TPR) repeat protein
MRGQILANKLSVSLFIVFVIGGLFLCAAVLAEKPDMTTAHQLFYEANSAYKQARYAEAVEDYERLIESGLESGNLYYNLGNSYFKKGELGKAVLNYERAMVFIPNDSDLRFNYEYTLSLLDLRPQVFGNWFTRIVNRMFRVVGIDLLTVMLSVIYIIAILLCILELFVRGFRRFSRPAVLILIILLVFSALALHNKIAYLKTGAVVIIKEADVKFEPSRSATTYFKLAEGSSVEIIEKRGQWCKIKRLDAKTGWVDKAGLGTIAD